MSANQDRRLLKSYIMLHFDNQGDFGRAVEMTPSDVSQVLKGREKLTLDQAGRWTSILHCPAFIIQPFV